jgi:hypothetical protein
MLRKETWSFPTSRMRPDDVGMNNSMHYPIPLSTVSRDQSKTRRGEIGLSAATSKLFGEWQQRGPEGLSGLAFRKLRLTLVPPQSVAAANTHA